MILSFRPLHDFEILGIVSPLRLDRGGSSFRRVYPLSLLRLRKRSLQPMLVWGDMHRPLYPGRNLSHSREAEICTGLLMLLRERILGKLNPVQDN